MHAAGAGRRGLPPSPLARRRTPGHPGARPPQPASPVHSSPLPPRFAPRPWARAAGGGGEGATPPFLEQTAAGHSAASFEAKRAQCPAPRAQAAPATSHPFAPCRPPPPAARCCGAARPPGFGRRRARAGPRARPHNDRHFGNPPFSIPPFALRFRRAACTRGRGRRGRRRRRRTRPPRPPAGRAARFAALITTNARFSVLCGHTPAARPAANPAGL
ncbi:MAG: hypothetical protein J3K34DRAFT_432296 [Monoraphidium minutum]|nr:MAG: hypothetical protein J3K34DRAFT_432296 [Monoraphidium minutum]